MKVFKDRGITLIELAVSMAIISILALAILPLSKISTKRAKELELREHLRIIRDGIDEYKKLVDQGKIEKDSGDSGYPKNLQVLVEGVDLKQAVLEKKKFLRRIPRDSMTEDGEWGLRSYFDEPDSEIWGGEDVYDVYSKSEGTALDGTKYNTW
ncbi:MAG: type II secretion system protein [Thermodesulfobacteriota bacterium]|nr:type II secretion system protein [Thermodesulfobacteriota bacterium]